MAHGMMTAMEVIPDVDEPCQNNPDYVYLKHFQCERLKGTYQDFLDDAEHHQVCDFFLRRIYSTEDTTSRDRAFKRIHEVLKRTFGGRIAEDMRQLIELQDLTIQLDLDLLAVLKRLDAPQEFDMTLYEQAYREADNHELRVRQIELLVFTVRLTHTIAHQFGIGMALKTIRVACSLLGGRKMLDFLHDGYEAFRGLERIDLFAEAIEQREMARLNRIYQV